MPKIPAYLGLATWSGPRPGSFKPLGRLRVEPDRPTLGEALGSVDWSSDETLSARLFVGFSVGSAPTYDLDDLIAVVRAARSKNGGDPAATFLAQRGIYRYRSGEVVEEDGGQVIIIDTAGSPRATFENQMVALAEEIAREMKQELVVVEIQKNGVVQQTYGVVP